MEKDKKYEIAKYCYPNPDKEKNPEAEDEICKEHRVDMSELFGGSTGERSVLFPNLETDTIYTAELDGHFKILPTRILPVVNIFLVIYFHT